MEPAAPLQALDAARLFRDCRVRGLRRPARGREEADPRHFHLLRGRHRRRRRHVARPADRRAGLLGAHQRDPADLHRRGARWSGWRAGALIAGRPCCGSTPPASPLTRPTARPRRWRYGVAPVPAFAMGVLDRLRRRDHPRRARRRAVDPDAARALRDRRRAVVGPVRGAGPRSAWRLPIAAGIAAVAGFALRGLAIARGWSLPAYRD